jgi:hypothetical protein
VSGVYFFADEYTSMELANTAAATTALEIPARDAWNVVEGLLVRNRFALTLARRDEPRFVKIHSLTRGRRPRLLDEFAYVPPQELSAWRDHPAFLIMTLFHAHDVDARELTEIALRLQTDTKIEHVIPLSETNGVIVSGAAHAVGAIAAMVSSLDARTP